MKKSAAILAIVMLAATPVLAAQQGGFVDPSVPKTQVHAGGF